MKQEAGDGQKHDNAVSVGPDCASRKEASSTRHVVHVSPDARKVRLRECVVA